MAWIKSNPELLGHPKMLRLMDFMGWDIDQTVGKLHRLWWWCLKYAPTGNIEKFKPEDIAHAIGVKPDLAHKLVESFVNSGLVDQNPLRVHGWLDYAGEMLATRKRSKLYRQRMKRDKSVPSCDGHVTERAKSRVEKSRVEKSNIPQAVDVIKTKTDIQTVIEAYKQAKGFNVNDKSWDKQNFSRFSRDAKNLLEVTSGPDEACECIREESAWLNSKSLDWNLGTISKRFFEWKSRKSKPQVFKSMDDLNLATAKYNASKREAMEQE